MTRFCKECSANISNCHPNALFCNRECGQTHVRKLKSEEIRAKNPNALQCRACQLFVDKGLIKHLNKLHGLSVEAYKQQYGQDAPIVSESTSKKLSENNKGEKNAWFNHGGKLSRFSKNHVSYDGLSDEEKEKQIDEFLQTLTFKPEKLNNRIEFYLAKGMTEEEAKTALKERQAAFTLEKCIKKYGQEAGLKRWQDRQEKWQQTLANKSIEEIELINLKKQTGFTGSSSRISQKLFEQLHMTGARWGTQKTKGLGEITIRGNGRTYMLDFVYKNKCIEFNGDYWHANPKKHEKDRVIGKVGHTVKTAEEIWELDAKKAECIKNAGYDLMVVWESDFRKDPEGTIEKCRAFLNS